MSIHDAKVIDIHAHAVLEETFGTAGAYGPELYDDADGTPIFRIGGYRLRGVRYRGSPFMDPDLRIAAMDRSGIDWQLLSPNPLTYFHYIPAAEATSFCRRHNDALAALVARYPDRLGAAAALPMQDIDAAIAELRRAVGELGMRAAYIGTDGIRGLDDPEMDAFYEAVTALDVPLFLHPAPAGIDGPKASAAMSRYELDITTGFTMQETLALATLVYGGVLHRHPTLDICISHGGGAIALLWGRLEHAAHKRRWAPDHLKADGAFAAELQRIWYDIHVHDDRAVDLLVERVGTERLVYGTNFSGWDAPERFESPRCDAPLADNARRLLRA
ncbi:amidohydrolase family protein [Sphingosinicella microcystinivorans]|uniref:Aminocarboxymuconate-semialdehyde decarboxylase n=1 Tax=Sphingosinicella microcystinivorans TaxID=335406 RepID=A0AAD1D9B1_SPHMI|nr:amidohydrolase family protein [Sphingosinicella microcystinivorans]RKS86306.1 aminocarboxymuconate-semialdehyde decarboxylase [Sphingosinicella microcystinivorans]BBE35649.1 putative amidohydrolase (aminocarboxymuconate-semialdehyde decarboxylase) [Sphingosinicella microcystinivorans]